MRRDVQVFINSQRLDLFDFEDINIIDSVQDVGDISKLFVPFSREFTVPASKNNNKIFKHYYNQNLTNGFDARFKISATIKINTQVYKKGRVTLLGATLRNNAPHNYKLVFYDNTVDLKSLLGDDYLSDIGSSFLSQYNLVYDSLASRIGMGWGYNLNSGVLEEVSSPEEEDYKENPADIIVPFISTNNYYYFDTADGVSPNEGDSESRNIEQNSTQTNRGLFWKDLRPSLRADIVIEAIEEKYVLTFADGFFNDGTEEFKRLYLWLNRDEGTYGEEKTVNVDFSDFTYTSGDPDERPIYTSSGSGFFVAYITVSVDSASTEYNLKVINKDDGLTLLDSIGKGNNTFNLSMYNYGSDPSKLWDLNFEVSNLESSTLDINVNLAFFSGGFQRRSYYDYSDSSTDNIFNMADNMPKIKVIDFLTGLFKMFNLTAYTNDDNEIVVKTLDDYYNSGNTIDITKFVDSSETSVERNKLYSQIDFEYDEPKTFATINSNEITSDEFGNERINNVYDDEALRNILAFDGGEYEVSVGFEKMQYERMTNQDDESLINIGWGWSVDDDQSPTETSPILHYVENIYLPPLDGQLINIDKGDGTYILLDRYYRPSNSLSTPSIHRQSLNFGSEFDEYYNDLGSNEVSLFTRYWKNYILSIYDKQSRIVTLKAHLPVSIINTIKLNDVLVIRNKKYRINKLDVKITTGETKLELVTYKEITPFYNDDYRVDIDTITVDSNLITVDAR